MKKHYFIRGQTLKNTGSTLVILLAYICFGRISFAQNSDTTNYFPLQIGNKWIFYDSYYCPPEPMRVVTGFRTYWTVNDSIHFNNKKYYETIVGQFEAGWDTVRIDSSNNLVIYKKGKERIFYKFNAKVGDSWEYIDTLFRSERKFIVTLLSRVDTVKTLAGLFANCLKFQFKVSNNSNYDFIDFMAPNTGLIYRCKWEPIGLYEAYIGNKHYEPNSVPEVRNSIDFKLYQNYPNPFNPSTVIKYEISKQSIVKLKIFDMAGKEIRSLLEETKLPGIYETVWDGKDNSGKRVSSGFYMSQISSGNFKIIKKLLLIK